MKTANRTFIISGGSSGLGLSTAQSLLSSSPSTCVAILDLARPPTDLDSKPPNVLFGMEDGKGPGQENGKGRVRFFKTDVTKVEDIQKSVEGAVAWCEETGKRLGGVICCAGVGAAAKIINHSGDPHPLDLWDFMLSVNLTGTFNLIRLVLPHFIKVEPEPKEEGVDGDGERGVVVMISSSAAFEGQPGQAAYSATKGAVSSMTLPLARDLGRYGIRVVSIAPGPFESNMTKRISNKARESLVRDLVWPKRFGNPEEFGQTVMWIIECTYINGETIRLNGAGRLPGKL